MIHRVYLIRIYLKRKKEKGKAQRCKNYIECKKKLLRCVLNTFLYPLTLEQETECLQKMKNGDLEARNELILRNMRLVAHVAKKYQSREDDLEDLISIGTIGLIKAISTYKETYGSRLATYAVRCIDNVILSPMRF